MMKRTFGSLIVLFYITMLLAACASPLVTVAPDTDGEPAGMSSFLTLRIEDGSRGMSPTTILPGALKDEIDGYEVKLVYADKTVLEFSGLKDTYPVEAGDANLTVLAKKGSLAIAQYGPAAIKLGSGTSIRTVTLSPLQLPDQAGILDAGFTWERTFEQSELKLFAWSDAGQGEEISLAAVASPDNLSQGTSSAALKLRLPPAAYLLQLRLKYPGTERWHTLRTLAQVYSNRTSSKTFALDAALFTQAPAAPSQLSASRIGNTGNWRLAWTVNSLNEDGFELYRIDNGGAPVKVLTQPLAAKTGTVDITFTGSATPVRFEIAAVNHAGASARAGVDVRYTLGYDLNGGVGTIPESSLNNPPGTPLVLAAEGNLAGTVLAGHTAAGIRQRFLGWSTDPAATTADFLAGTSHTLVNSLTLYAVYTQDTAVIGKRGPAGGLVFYAKANVSEGWRYLEVAPHALANGISPVPWTNAANEPTKATDGWGAGKQNTRLLSLQAGYDANVASAVSLCDSLVYGGFDDWYLPSISELEELVKQRFVLGIGRDAPQESRLTWDVWSSTEANETNAKFIWVDPDSDTVGSYEIKDTELKSSGRGAWAVRSFAEAAEATRIIMYHPNGADSGIVPVDQYHYKKNTFATVSDNTGNLGKLGFKFEKWNAQADGNGVPLYAGDSVTIGVTDRVLYAQWTTDPFVYVSTTGNDGTGTGNRLKPFATIQKGIDVAKNSGLLKVRIATGTYTIASAITLMDGVSLYGSFDPATWTPDTVNTTTIVATSASDIKGIQSSSLPTAAELSGLVVQVDAGGAAATGIYLDNSPLISVRNCTISAASTNSTATGLEIKGPYNGVIEKNTIASANSPRYSYGLFFTGSGNVTAQIRNNVLTAVNGSNNDSLALGWTATGSHTLDLIVRNNTIRFGSCSVGSFGIGQDFYASAGATVYLIAENNIIYSTAVSGNRYAIGNGDGSAPAVLSIVSLKNNNFFATLAMYRMKGGSSYTTTAELHANVTNASGNVSEVLTSGGFVNNTSDLRLTVTAPLLVKTGGLDGAAQGWGFTTDRVGVTRTGSSGTGWSIGAYENDM